MTDRFQLISDDSVWMFPADITLSTVQLPEYTLEFRKIGGYESCLFFLNGDSDVVATYDSLTEAVRGHNDLEKKFKLKRVKKNDNNSQFCYTVFTELDNTRS